MSMGPKDRGDAMEDLRMVRQACKEVIAWLQNDSELTRDRRLNMAADLMCCCDVAETTIARLQKEVTDNG
jgi:hypothetical protein